MARVPLHELDAKRIVLLKPSALGDIVHSLPVLHALRVRFPAAQITWVVNRAYAALLAGHPDLTDVIAFDRPRPIRAAVGLARELSRRQFDLVIDLQGLFRTGLMAAVTRAPRRVGLSSAREVSRLACTDVLRVSPEVHAVERYWRVAEALGVGDISKVFHLPVAEAERAWAEKALADLPRPLLAVAAGSRWYTKRWRARHFAELAGRAQRSFGVGVALVGAPDEAPLSRSIMPHLSGRVLDLTGLTTLPRLVAVLALADVVLANDSGPLHLAAALGRPVVAPYTCTRIGRHGPFGQSGAVATRVACAGSYRRRCRRLDCMAELTPDRLWPALDEVLHSWASPCRSA